MGWALYRVGFGIGDPFLGTPLRFAPIACNADFSRQSNGMT